MAAEEQRRLWSFIRHARLEAPAPTSSGLRIRDLVEEFDRLPRSGDTTYGMAVGIYPVADHPRLPPPDAG